MQLQTTESAIVKPSISHAIKSISWSITLQEYYWDNSLSLIRALCWHNIVLPWLETRSTAALDAGTLSSVVASTRTYKYEYKYEYLGCKNKYCETVLEYKYKYQVLHHHCLRPLQVGLGLRLQVLVRSRSVSNF